MPPLDDVDATNATLLVAGRNCTGDWWNNGRESCWFESLWRFLVYGVLFNLTIAVILICCGLRKPRARKLTPGPRPDQRKFMASQMEKLCFKGDRKRWPLVWAAAHGDLTTIRRLIEEGADLNERNTDFYHSVGRGPRASGGGEAATQARRR